MLNYAKSGVKESCAGRWAVFWIAHEVGSHYSVLAGPCYLFLAAAIFVLLINSNEQIMGEPKFSRSEVEAISTSSVRSALKLLPVLTFRCCMFVVHITNFLLLHLSADPLFLFLTRSSAIWPMLV
jgi:hypothetical protein